MKQIRNTERYGFGKRLESSPSMIGDAGEIFMFLISPLPLTSPLWTPLLSLWPPLLSPTPFALEPLTHLL
ncbi:unnamed protein product, partial [Iphiclides podalirius]